MLIAPGYGTAPQNAKGASHVETAGHRRQHAPDQSADLVLPWLTEKVSGHEAFDVEFVDLRDWPLPIFGEHFGTIGDFNDPTYSEPIVKAWNDKIKEADAYVIVTPEYNHSVPGGLKNAIDSVWVSFGFRNKPSPSSLQAAAAGCGPSSTSPTSSSRPSPCPAQQRGHSRRARRLQRDGQPKNPVMNAAADIMLDDLAWWAAALDKARAGGELRPGTFRLQAALAAAS